MLVVDDEPSIRRLLRITLERAGYAVAEAFDAREALASIADADPSAILLDLGLPDRNGIELIPILGKISRAAVLVVSARAATTEKVAALDLGATDYLTKPFDTEELLARLRAAIRNRITKEGGTATIVSGNVTIDLLGRMVVKNGEEVHLTPKEFAIVAELARFPGRVITHQHLLSTVWPAEYEHHVEYLRVVIRNLRAKIEDDPARPRLVVNVLGVGYRFIADEPSNPDGVTVPAARPHWSSGSAGPDTALRPTPRHRNL
ncbi:response regulator [uncultured Sphingomonas sp.]|uniref:response regulator n=1 Tax=uncultured Sphingomonas sp. TaxID=158754 RepID=UPI0035CB43C1